MKMGRRVQHEDGDEGTVTQHEDGDEWTVRA